MSDETNYHIQQILDRHHIAPQHRADFNRLIEEGEIESLDFRRRLHFQVNYRVACEEIMELLSMPFYHLTLPGPAKILPIEL
jgi:hypothetical protein